MVSLPLCIVSCWFVVVFCNNFCKVCQYSVSILKLVSGSPDPFTSLRFVLARHAAGPWLFSICFFQVTCRTDEPHKPSWGARASRRGCLVQLWSCCGWCLAFGLCGFKLFLCCQYGFGFMSAAGLCHAQIGMQCWLRSRQMQPGSADR